jgi:RsiW-degrading membrane proteinase PrsW (M82 family)
VTKDLETGANRLHWLSLGQFALSGLGLLILFTTAFGLAAGALVLLSAGQLGEFRSAGLAVGNNPFYSFAWLAVFFALLTIPSVVYSFARLLGKDTTAFEHKTARLPLRLSILLMLLWPLVLLAGHWLTQNSRLGWLMMPPLQIASVAIPAWWVIEMARFRLRGVSAQRVWGAVNFGFLVSTNLILLVEVVLLLAALVGLGLLISANPEASGTLERMFQRLTMARADPEVAMRILKPYLQQPVVLVLLLVGVAGFVPLVEELIKPLGIWMLAGKNITPASGFILGAASGCGFAMLESLGMLSNPSQNGWVVLAVGRMGTGLLHITASALVGWGLALAWREKKYIQLGLLYASAVILHGIWNLFGLMMGLSPLLEPAPPRIEFFVRLGKAAPLALSILAAVLFIVLLLGNRYLQLQQAKIMVNSTPVDTTTGDSVANNT